MTGRWVEAAWGDLQAGTRVRLDDGRVGTLDSREWSPHALTQVHGPRQLRIGFVPDAGGYVELTVTETNTVWTEVDL